MLTAVVISVPRMLLRYTSPKHITVAATKAPGLILCCSIGAAGSLFTRNMSTGMPTRYMGSMEARSITSEFSISSGFSACSPSITATCAPCTTRAPIRKAQPSQENRFLVVRSSSCSCGASGGI